MIRYRTKVLDTIDLAGTFVLAVQGASTAAENGLDILGIVIVSMVTATGGGIVRDVLIGESPPEAFRGWRIVTTALVGAVATLFAVHLLESVPEALLTVVDALGLALLAVAGAEKALEYRLTPIAAVMMGAVSGVGGYTARDILLAQVPAILKADFLASAALAGAAVVVVARRTRLREDAAAFLGGGTCFVLRVIAVWQHWHLPRLG